MNYLYLLVDIILVINLMYIFMLLNNLNSLFIIHVDSEYDLTIVHYNDLNVNFYLWQNFYIFD